MSFTSKRSLLAVALCAAALVVFTSGPAGAASMTSTIVLDAGSNPSFTATLELGTGSKIAFGSNAVLGTYQVGTTIAGVGSHANFGFSISNQTGTLSASNVGLSTNTSTGTTSLTYNNLIPGTAETINSFSANLSGTEKAGFTINSTSVTANVDGISLNLTPTFMGTISNVEFVSTGPATVSGGSAVIPGNYEITLSGVVTASLSLVGNIGTIVSFTNTELTVAGDLPVNVLTSASGPGDTTLNVDYSYPSSATIIPFQLVEALSFSTHYSIGNTTGVSAVTIAGTTLTANLNLTNLGYNLDGSVTNALIPEPSSVILLGLGALGLGGGYVLKRRKSAA